MLYCLGKSNKKKSLHMSITGAVFSKNVPSLVLTVETLDTEATFPLNLNSPQPVA